VLHSVWIDQYAKPKSALLLFERSLRRQHSYQVRWNPRLILLLGDPTLEVGRGSAVQSFDSSTAFGSYQPFYSLTLFFTYKLKKCVKKCLG